jgi:mRNA-degrading endonuclease RelE of RelBE toxin-antitoxin system
LRVFFRKIKVYEIVIEKRAERDLKRLPAGLFQKLVPSIKKLKNNPGPRIPGRLPVPQVIIG